MEHKILIVEDEEEIRTLVNNHLKQEGFIVFNASDGEEAEAVFKREEVDLVLLDLMLPKQNGMELLKIVREASVVPVLIISAKTSELDKALGLGFGADDYISKPFSMIELTARVRAAIRRATQYAPPAEKIIDNTLQFKDITLDLDTFTASKNGKVIKLTAKEFQILKLFMTNPSRVFTKEQIYTFIWEDEYYGDENVINVHIRRLREKIEDDPSSPKYIQTIWGIGYKIGD
ncbi:MAG TPA: response regulator transcription factor [Bacillus sp. (in: firmicutes)]|uniref:response regulator transcription factor n=1 Tax=Bacillus litorisediminis TaxID=2922713 RepID=UPI002434FB35|nr:response regulator transcription factor [Bacillus litorisediminis]HWO78681.1 response regulator transcription factor [Bacillus sp. (in: firmicutes)]